MVETRIVRHPSFQHITHTVPLAALPEWLEQGWQPLLNETQEARYQQLATETPAVDEDPEPAAAQERPRSRRRKR